MPSEARQKKIMEKLNRAQKCSILGPQNLGSRGGPGPRAPPRIRSHGSHFCVNNICFGKILNILGQKPALIQ